MDAKSEIAAFLRGNTDIGTFRRMYDEIPEIDSFLCEVVEKKRKSGEPFRLFPFPHPFLKDTVVPSDEGVSYLLRPRSYPPLRFGAPDRYSSVRRMLTYKHGVISHDTQMASGALRFFREVLILYYQTDDTIVPTDRYEKALLFLRDTIPPYLYGGEALEYIEKVLIPSLALTGKNSENRMTIRRKLKEVFKSDKGFPLWVQPPAWPFGPDGKPLTYVNRMKPQGDIYRWKFRDDQTGAITIVRQHFRCTTMPDYMEDPPVIPWVSDPGMEPDTGIDMEVFNV